MYIICECMMDYAASTREAMSAFKYKDCKTIPKWAAEAELPSPGKPFRASELRGIAPKLKQCIRANQLKKQLTTSDLFSHIKASFDIYIYCIWYIVPRPRGHKGSPTQPGKTY